MELQTISSRIVRIISDLDALADYLRKMNTSIYMHNQYVHLSSDASLLGERIVCRLRHLLYDSTAVRKSDYLCRAAEAQGVRIENDAGIVTVTLEKVK